VMRRREREKRKPHERNATRTTHTETRAARSKKLLYLSRREIISFGIDACAYI
jgi:hypothetical protein